MTPDRPDLDDVDHDAELDPAMTEITPNVPLTRAELVTILGPDPDEAA